jgi:AcrR family transcriptional regulator
VSLEVRERGNASGRLTREVLIRTAERLFASRGIGAVSLREIGQAAGQRNNTVTQYHFGTRQDLIDAIYGYRVVRINDRRRELLKDLEADRDSWTVERLLDALLRPHAETIGDSDDNFLGFLARVLTDEARISVVATEHRGDVDAHLDGYRCLRAHVQAFLPELSVSVFEARFDLVFNWAIHALAEYARSTRSPDAADIDGRLAELVAMLANALRASAGLGRQEPGPPRFKAYRAP